MGSPAAPVARLRPQFLRANAREQRVVDGWKLRRRAEKACLRARDLCAAAAIEHRKVNRLANQLRLQTLKAWYAQLPDQLLLVPISGAGQHFQDDILQIKLDLLIELSVLTAHGEIDLGNIHILEEALNQLDEALPLVLDFTGVRYMDSCTVHLLLRTCDRYDIWHTPVALVVNGITRRICLLAGLQERLSLFADAVIARRHLVVGQRRVVGETATE